jgi:hypothetical protein
MATATAIDQSKLQKIINNSGIDISVCMPLTTAETENSNAIISYNKDWVLLKTSNGGTVIKAGTSDTVTLDRTQIDSTTKKPVYVMNYDLIISNPTWLSPIANIGVIQDYDDSTDPETDFFDDVTVSADYVTVMQQTSNFCQTIAAYPDSQLAKDYVNAMNSTNTNVDNSDGSSDGVNNAMQGIAAFFAGTKSYQKVTMASIVVFEAYCNRFPFIWAGNADKVTYYLYTSDGTKTTFQGALTMSKSGVIDISKQNGGYTCTFTPAVNPSDLTKTDVNTASAKTLTFSDGLFVDDTTTDVPSIAVKGSFQLKRTFTKDPNDTKIIVVISGTVNGVNVLGFDQSQCTNPDDTTQDWLTSLFHPKTAAEIFTSVMTILGALMMLHFVVTTLWGISKWVKGKVAAKEPITKEDLAAKKNSLESDFKARQSENLKKASANKETLPDSAEDGLSKAVDSKGTVSDCVSAGQMESNLTNMKNNLKNLEEYVVEDYTGTMQGKINDAAVSIRDAYTKVSTAEFADLKATVAELRPQMQTLSQQVSDLNTTMQKMVAQQEQANMEENVKNMETVQDNIDNDNETANEEDTDTTDADPKADPVEIPTVDV